MASNDVCEMRLVMAAALTARRETSNSFRVRDIRSCPYAWPGSGGGPPLKASLDPPPGLLFGHRRGHHREPGYVRIPVHGPGDRGRITGPEQAQSPPRR